MAVAKASIEDLLALGLLTSVILVRTVIHGFIENYQSGGMAQWQTFRPTGGIPS